MITRFLACFLLMLLVALLSARASYACSVSRFAGQRSATGTYFLATATADTLRAGPGTTTFYHPHEFSDTALSEPLRPIYGQVLRLEEVGGFLADSVREAAAQHGGEIVVVPWSDRSDCRTVAWPVSAAWVPPGSHGFYLARLRPRGEWVDGRPTFDVRGSHDPYPQAVALHMDGVSPDSALTPEQFFSLHAALPTGEALERDAYAALEPLQQWLREHPDLADLTPVPEILEDVYISAEYARVATIVPPMIGTYRVQVRPAGKEPLILFFRTTARPTPHFRTEDQPAGSHSGAEPWRTDSYGLQVYGAEADEQIAETRQGALEANCSVSGLTVSADAEADSSRSSGDQVWHAHLDWGMLRRCFRDDPDIARAVESYVQQLELGEDDSLPGTFREKPNGAMYFEQVLRSDGKVLLSVGGERISGETTYPR